ncbi:EamA family transporter RarD [Neisseria animalis]|uniref:EamA family transporter RarD n=1 Tax=Neisseria animalis TaxID=492 RepID=A0A5P3MQK2_NEIAN|nr:EamA family transporter RarD [Neisseria animalis]QEY23854.1 EamA family transporter RarD [Neisseria animalis]ROW32078.1 EamA family transporter RarD [Neisseria animalis]VEE05717.1 putative chloramphenical resistance permease RarD [Neisseria animalis]
MKTPVEEYRKGLLFALGCYLIWGLFPLYWYPVTAAPIDAGQIMAQRVSWSAVFAVAVLLIMKQGNALFNVFADRRLLLTLACSAAAISINWLVYLWAISRHYILDASLGYFISPLVNIAFGRIFFKENLSRTQTAAIVLALTGIMWLALPAGHVPWIALILAVSFGVYSLLRKLAPVDALTGMTVETLLMLPFALAYLGYTAIRGELVFGSLNTLQTAVVIGSGAVTVLPLLMFAAGAKRISMSDLGMIQYLSPSMQFFLGLTLFGETFDLQRFTGYAWVWLGIAVYIAGAGIKRQRTPANR